MSFDSITVPDNHVYIMPTKMNKTQDDMIAWQNSLTYFEYLGFVYTLNDAIIGRNNEEGCENASREVDKVCELLNILDGWIDAIPAYNLENSNEDYAFRDWYSRLREQAIELLHHVVPESLYRAVPEIMIYLIEGFGNPTRIDYGIAHEMSFILFLCSLYKIGFLTIMDFSATVCKIFVRYMQIVRKLQVTYRMDSFGSFGVWSLNDYQFVPFIWGSSQLIDNDFLDPSSILKETIVQTYAKDYLFLSCIDYINQVKVGPFAEHSNQLWSISAVSSWAMMNSGLIRMYREDVLSQYSLVEQIYFGSLFNLSPVEVGASVRRPRLSSTYTGKFSESDRKSKVTHTYDEYDKIGFRQIKPTIRRSMGGLPFRHADVADAATTTAGTSREDASMKSSRDTKKSAASNDMPMRRSRDIKKSAALEGTVKEDISIKSSRDIKKSTASDDLSVRSSRDTRKSIASVGINLEDAAVGENKDIKPIVPSSASAEVKDDKSKISIPSKKSVDLSRVERSEKESIETIEIEGGTSSAIIVDDPSEMSNTTGLSENM